ncbi:hypothetical protein HPB48_004755 [Haemaphysalis longicornis]|uniref:Uncharacterized protein n=1 Tax=Haemaphysalis longicornis TaxID=44386 RepID=A0A9J6G2L9_HAELO|nr:hypothetical protein HPB48_004755 [Haemaphysalis longicornis]
MKADPKKCVLEIAKFLDRDRYEALLENEAMLAAVLKYSSPEYMKLQPSNGAGAACAAPLSSPDVPEIMRAVFKHAWVNTLPERCRADCA